jgi:hypothetical protein
VVEIVSVEVMQWNDEYYGSSRLEVGMCGLIPVFRTCMEWVTEGKGQRATGTRLTCKSNAA